MKKQKEIEDRKREVAREAEAAGPCADSVNRPRRPFIHSPASKLRNCVNPPCLPQAQMSERLKWKDWHSTPALDTLSQSIKNGGSPSFASRKWNAAVF